MSPRYPVRQRPAIHRSSFREWREDGDRASIETRPFWRWFDAASYGGDGVDAAQVLTPEEFRVLSKGASGGGFLVPTDLAESVHAAARAASPIAQLATEFPTQRGDTFNVSLAGTHGTGARIAESGSYTTSDETITNAALGAFKAGTKIIVSEELRTDEAVDMDDYLGVELGGRLGALQEAAFTVGDGSGKPLGVVTSGNGISVVTAATGSATSYKLADIKSVFKAVPQAYRRTASWLIGGDDFAELAALADTAGALVLPSLQFDPPSIFGRPVSCPATFRPRPPTPAVSCSATSSSATGSGVCCRSACSGKRNCIPTSARPATG